MRLKCAAVIPGVVATLAMAAAAQTLPTGVRKDASMGGITEYAFPNGLRVLLFPDPSNPKITVNMTYLVGSRFEGYGESGMAHLLEHMNFIQTVSGREIKKEIVDHGAQWNGTTSDDRTNYFETFMAGDDNLKWALGLEADRMVNVKMDKALLDTEMTVVRNEFERGENNPRDVLEERVLSTAYLWHNYGKSTIGSREDIEKVPIERLAAFYRKYYQPDNAVLVIAGQFDPSKALAFVAETCGRISRPLRKLDETYTVEPPQDGERTVELRRTGAGQDIMMAYHGPAAGNPDSAALEVLAGIMNGGSGGRGGRGGAGLGRLSKALVDNKKALSANLSLHAMHDPGYVLVSASLSADQSLEEARRIMIQTLDGIVNEPPTKEEVERAKTRLLQGLEQRLTNAQQLALSLSAPIAEGDWRLMFLEHDQIRDVTPDDLIRVAKLYFKASNRTVGEFIPTSNPDRTVVPATDLGAELKNYTSSVTISQGEAFEPTPANIERRIVRLRLANGMKVAMLPRKTTGGTVSAVVQIHFGDEKSLAGRSAVAEMAGALLMRGTKNKTRQQLQDEMDRLNARIFVGGSLTEASASINTKAENLVAALRLAVEMLREPAYSEIEYDRVRDQRIKGLEQIPTEPELLAAETLRRNLSPYAKGDALYFGERPERLEELKKVTLGEVKDFHAKFYGASHGEFAVVGQFDQAAVEKTAADLLGGWSSPAPYQRLLSHYKSPAPVNRKIETPDKQNAQFMAGLRIKMSEDDADYPAMVLANYMFGGPITARMPNRIRNIEGLSYGAASRFTAPVDGDAALFSATVSSNPLNTAKVESSFKDELEKTLKEGFTPEEVATAKKALLDEMTVGRSQEGTLVRLLASHEYLGRTMEWDEQMQAKIQALTPGEITTAFRSHIDPAAISIVKAGDFKSPPAP